MIFEMSVSENSMSDRTFDIYMYVGLGTWKVSSGQNQSKIYNTKQTTNDKQNK